MSFRKKKKNRRVCVSFVVVIIVYVLGGTIELNGLDDPFIFEIFGLTFNFEGLEHNVSLPKLKSYIYTILVLRDFSIFLSKC